MLVKRHGRRIPKILSIVKHTSVHSSPPGHKELEMTWRLAPGGKLPIDIKSDVKKRE